MLSSGYFPCEERTLMNLLKNSAISGLATPGITTQIQVLSKSQSWRTKVCFFSLIDQSEMHDL